MKPTVQRIYTPFTQNQCIATPYVYVDGKEISFQPLEKGTVQIELIEDVKRSRIGIFDDSYSLTSKEMGLGEMGQIEMTLVIPDEDANPASSSAKIGLYDGSLPHLLENGAQESTLKVEGTFGEDTLKVFGLLADVGNCLTIKAIHFDADDDRHFASRMTKSSFTHDGTSTNESILYPRSMANDEQTTIRSMTGLDIKLDGFSYLEMPMYKGIVVNLTITTEFTKKA